MKPIVIVVGKSGIIEMTAAELEKLITEAYEQGRADAPRYYPYMPHDFGKPYCNTWPKITTGGSSG